MKKTILIVFLAFLCIVAGSAVYVLSRYQNTSPKRPADRYDGNIKAVQSSSDTDGDGIDDQTDILNGALDYVSTKPKYKSAYYGSGYPDDEYGVCTDVVAFAMKNAGFDLMELVAKDIEEHPESYDISTPDSRIDFRRVRNLKVYFLRSALSLTTDVYDIEAWQGGDIVVFEGHIGIVSDIRNANGVPYVIHHSNPWQPKYEQDILERHDDIVAHFRVD